MYCKEGMDVAAGELLGISPPLKPQKGSLKLCPVAPDEACREEDGSSSSSEKEGHQGRKRKTVTFAEFTNEPKGIMDQQDLEDEDEDTSFEHPSPCNDHLSHVLTLS
jgi:hypothetical protein